MTRRESKRCLELSRNLTGKLANQIARLQAIVLKSEFENSCLQYLYLEIIMFSLSLSFSGAPALS